MTLTLYYNSGKFVIRLLFYDNYYLDVQVRHTNRAVLIILMK